MDNAIADGRTFSITGTDGSNLSVLHAVLGEDKCNLSSLARGFLKRRLQHQLHYNRYIICPPFPTMPFPRPEV